MTHKVLYDRYRKNERLTFRELMSSSSKKVKDFVLEFNFNTWEDGKMNNDIVINGYKVSDEFIKEYEAYMERIKFIENGELYKINLTLSDEGVEASIMKEFEPDEGVPNETGFVKLSEREAIFFEEIIYDDEGVDQIIMGMHEDLEDEKYGTYTWQCVRL